MAQKRLFKSRISSCSYFFKNGKQAAFMGGRYMTDVEWEIKELEAEIGFAGLKDKSKSNHPHIYIDPNETQVTEEMLDPIAAIKKKAIEEYLESQRAAMDAKANVSKSEMLPPTTGMVTSQTIAEAASGSDSSEVAAIVSVPKITVKK